MKKYIALLLILCTVSLCWACSKGKTDTVQGPQVRYEDATAYYTHEGSTYTMDLQFEQTLTPGSKISLLLEGDEVLGFTTEAAISRLFLSSPKLEKDKDYTIEIDGRVQKHGARHLLDEFPRPGDIPAPTQPTIPVAPMGEPVTLPTTTEGTETTPHNSGSLEVPPTVYPSDIPVGGIPSLEPTEPTNGTLPSVGFSPEKEEPKDDLTIRPAPQSSGTAFTLTGPVTEFTSVGDAS